MEITQWFRPDSLSEFRTFLMDTTVYEIGNMQAIARETVYRGSMKTFDLPPLSNESNEYIREFVDDPTKTSNKELGTALEGLGLLHIVLLARLASGRPPFSAAMNCIDLILDAAKQANPRQPFAEGLKLWANLFNAYGGRNAHGPALRAVVHLLVTIHKEQNRIALLRHLPPLVHEVTRLLVGDPVELSELTPVRWEQMRVNAASATIDWAHFAERHKIPLSQGAMRLRYALFIGRTMHCAGSPLLFPDDGFELSERLLARGIDLSTLKTFLVRYGEKRVIWLMGPGRRVDGRFLRELSRMFGVFASAHEEQLTRMHREWQDLYAMGTTREFTVRQFLELGGTLDAALEELSRPEPPSDPTNVVELFPPAPIPKRLRLAVVNVTVDDLEVDDLEHGRHQGELIRTVCAEIWRIGYPGHFDPARATLEARLERLCLPKCHVTRNQFAETIAWLLVEGVIRREGMNLFPGPASRATDLGRTLAERAEALKRSALVPEQNE